MTEKDCKTFFGTQLETWELARRNCEELAQVSTRRLELSAHECSSVSLQVQFNPARIVSTGASIDKKSIAQRPCFLCEKNRPAEQKSMPMLDGRYELLVNPFPILPLHFTIASVNHERQSICNTFGDMVRIAAQLPDLFVFYNGPRCGASAPDHLHFQAGQRGIVPLQRDFNKVYRSRLKATDNVGLYQLKGYVVPAFVLLTQTVEDSCRLFHKLYVLMPLPKEDWEPMMNILSWVETAEDRIQFITIVIPRSKHRPDCYSAEEPVRCLVSPGALDMAGLLITPRLEDFNGMTAERAQQILREVAL